MSKLAYELSAWKTYPAANNLSEEKEFIIAATGMSDVMRAKNIELKREYNGKLTLIFTMPANFINENTGEKEINEMAAKINTGRTIKLWRDEKWWNPFASKNTTPDASGCYTFTGSWVRGRWYEFIVKNKTEKRNKKVLSYTYSCDSLFIDELTRDGYRLNFTNDVIATDETGLGTAHELAERVLDGTEWRYIKTEVFPDYKEEFNGYTGEIVRTPVETDELTFLNNENLKRYAYNYNLSTLTTAEKNQLQANLDNANVPQSGYYTFTPSGNNWAFTWRPTLSDSERNYIYGYETTDLNLSIATPIVLQDGGYPDKGASIFSDSVWESNPAQSFTIDSSGTAAEGDLQYYIHSSINNSSNIEYIYLGADTTAIKTTDYLVINFDYVTSATASVDLIIYDESVKDDNNNLQPIFTYNNLQPSGYNRVSGADFYNNSYWFVPPTYIKNPRFALNFTNNSGSTITVDLKRFYVYKFTPYDSTISTEMNNAITAAAGNMGLMSGLSGLSADYHLSTNTYGSGTSAHPIWQPFSEITNAVHDTDYYLNGTNQYLVEFQIAGNFVDVYLPIKDNKVTKRSSFTADKRRLINNSKTNRMSILENIAKTFSCFTKFYVEYENNGQIKRDTTGKPIKYITYSSSLGRNQFAGFKYGLNLDSIERKNDATNLTTKMYVENIDNTNVENGTVSITQSQYNTLGESYLYNFYYYILTGEIDKRVFLDDYNELIKNVGSLNVRLKEDSAKLADYNVKLNQLESSLYTYQTAQKSIKTTIEKTQKQLNWSGMEAAHQTSYGAIGTNLTFPTIKFYNANAGFNYTVTASDTTPPSSFSFYDSTAEDQSLNGRLKAMAEFLTEHLFGTDHTTIINQTSNTAYSNLLTILNAQTKYNNYQIKVDDLTNQINNIKATILTLETEQIDFTKHKSIFTNIFEKKYRKYIKEGTWKGSDYINDDDYCLDALRTMTTSCMPKVSYSMNVLDLSEFNNPEYPVRTEDDATSGALNIGNSSLLINETDYLLIGTFIINTTIPTQWGEDFIYDVGDTTYIEDNELFGNAKQKAILSSITSYIDSLKSDNIEIKNYDTRFEELFKSVAAAVLSLSLNENIYSRAANFDAAGNISVSSLKDAFTNNSLVMQSSNSTVNITDTQGIKIIDTENKNLQVHIIGKGIYLTNNNGESYEAGISAEGINTNLLTAGIIDADKIIIRNGNSKGFEWSALGLSAYSDKADSIVRHDQFGIYLTKDFGTFARENWWRSVNDPVTTIKNNSVFSLTKDGFWYKDGTVDGYIQLGNFGNLSGLKIVDTNSADRISILSDGSFSIKNTLIDETNHYELGLKSPTGISGLAYEKVLWIGTQNTPEFYVTGTGVLHATGAVIEGDITAKGMTVRDNADKIIFSADTNNKTTQIGGWIASSNMLTKADGETITYNGTTYVKIAGIKNYQTNKSKLAHVRTNCFVFGGDTIRTLPTGFEINFEIASPFGSGESPEDTLEKSNYGAIFGTRHSSQNRDFQLTTYSTASNQYGILRLNNQKAPETENSGHLYNYRNMNCSVEYSYTDTGYDAEYKANNTTGAYGWENGNTSEIDIILFGVHQYVNGASGATQCTQRGAGIIRSIHWTNIYYGATKDTARFCSDLYFIPVKEYGTSNVLFLVSTTETGTGTDNIIGARGAEEPDTTLYEAPSDAQILSAGSLKFTKAELGGWKIDNYGIINNTDYNFSLLSSPGSDNRVLTVGNNDGFMILQDGTVGLTKLNIWADPNIYLYKRYYQINNLGFYYYNDSTSPSKSVTWDQFFNHLS